MTLHATGIFTVKDWNEKAYSEIAGQPKLVRVEVVYTYQGDLAAEGKVVFQMCYASNGIAYFIGFDEVTGRLGERAGSFVLQHVGTFREGAITDNITVVPGAATGDLSGLVGGGICGGDGEATYTLDYDLP